MCSENNYNVSDGVARDIFDRKDFLCNKCKQSWPAYASYEEDKCLRNAIWTEKFGDIRLILWDNTNINFNYKPSYLFFVLWRELF